MPIRKLLQDQARRVVRNSQDPVRRAQALVLLARQAPDGQRAETLLHKALDEARHVSEPYLVVREAAAALRVLLQRKRTADLAADVDRLIAICETEENPIRRGDALRLVAWAIQDAAPELFWKALEACATAYRSAHGYRREYRLRQLVRAVNNLSHARALALAQEIQRPRDRRRALRTIGESDDASGADAPVSMR